MIYFGWQYVSMDIEDTVQKLKKQKLTNEDLQSTVDMAIEIFKQKNYNDAMRLFILLYEENYLCDEILQVIMECYYKPNKTSFKNSYEKNVKYLEEYPYIMNNNFPEFDKISDKVVYVSENKYILYNKKSKKFGELYQIKDEKEDIPFFLDTEKQLFLKNERNHWNIKYLWDNVRRSEDYGEDNHIYLYYDSFEIFCAYLQTMDIVEYLKDEKFVFLFGEAQLKDYYPIDFKTMYGIDYASMKCQPIRINEIKRVFVEWFELTMSGNYFLAGVLDCHKNLLTVKEFGLAGFDYLYQQLLKDKSIDEVFQSLLENKDGLIYSEIMFLIKPGLTEDAIKVPTLEEFFTQLKIVLKDKDKPTRLEWFKSLYLAYSMSIGRSFKQRIAPAIVFHTHGMGYPTSIDDMYDVFRSFEYFKAITIIRRPIVTLGARVGLFERQEPGKENYIKCINDYVLADDGLMSRSNYRLYLPPDDEFLPHRRVIRFEDLKLYPTAMLLNMCEFLDIEWDDILLKTTANGTENAMKMEKDRKVGGFDTAPVYNKHEECFSSFDYYRIELVKSIYYMTWGYKPVYYYDPVKYSKSEILKMFEIKFKCENFHSSQQQLDVNQRERDKLYKLVSSLINTPIPLDEAGEKLIPIPWLKPKLELVNGDLYE